MIRTFDMHVNIIMNVFSLLLVNKNIFKKKEFILSLRVVYNNKACVCITYMFSTLIIKSLLRRFKLLRSWRLFECSFDCSQ